jgi:hypothetical protein
MLKISINWNFNTDLIASCRTLHLLVVAVNGFSVV